MILAFYDCCRHDDNREVPVGRRFGVRNYIRMKLNAQEHPEPKLDL